MPGVWYSTGSSTVMILRSSPISSLRNAYKDVVFPLPVGPVTIMMPLLDFSNCCVVSRWSPNISNSDKLDTPSTESSSLSTRLSPATPGVVATLISRSLPETLVLIRPSWGNRFSEISRLAINFNLETIAACIPIPGRSISFITPSTRMRTRKTPR